jgi:exodeoxyribonuclease VIII
MLPPEQIEVLQGLDAGEGVCIDNISNADYHAAPGLSVSGAKRLLVTPYHYHALTGERTAPPKAPTAGMVNGTLVHCLVLEPDEFGLRYAVGPDEDVRSKAWKAFALDAHIAGLEVVTQVQYDRARGQAQALRAVPEVAELLLAGNAEQSVWWRDTAHGLLLKCRPDWRAPVNNGRGVVLLDVKTATDASDEGFASACAKFGYYMQDPWYCEGVQVATGLDVHGMVFGVVENEFPYAARAFMLSDEARAAGREAFAKARATYAACITRGEWPGYPSGIAVIDLPRWFRATVQA